MTRVSNPNGQRRSIAVILRDQLWQSVGAIATIIFGLLSVAVASYIYFLSLESKNLGVTVLTNTVLAKVEPSIASDITLLYKGQPTNGLSLVTVKIENTGNRTIWKTDYDRPIRLVFPAATEIVSADVVETNPKEIDVEVSKAHNVAVIDPVMLNQGDRFIVRLVANSTSPDADTSDPFSLDVRIAGIRDVLIVNAIEQQQPVKTTSPLLVEALGALVILLFLSIAFYLSGLIHRKREQRSRIEDGLDQIKKGLK